MKTAIELAREAFVYSDCTEWTIAKSKTFVATHESIRRLVELVRADERARVTNVLLEMHDNAAPPHPYYKHAAIEINRK